MSQNRKFLFAAAFMVAFLSSSWDLDMFFATLPSKIAVFEIYTCKTQYKINILALVHKTCVLKSTKTYCKITKTSISIFAIVQPQSNTGLLAVSVRIRKMRFRSGLLHCLGQPRFCTWPHLGFFAPCTWRSVLPSNVPVHC